MRGNSLKYSDRWVLNIVKNVVKEDDLQSENPANDAAASFFYARGIQLEWPFKGEDILVRTTARGELVMTF